MFNTGKICEALKAVAHCTLTALMRSMWVWRQQKHTQQNPGTFQEQESSCTCCFICRRVSCQGLRGGSRGFVSTSRIVLCTYGFLVPAHELCMLTAAVANRMLQFEDNAPALAGIRGVPWQHPGCRCCRSSRLRGCLLGFADFGCRCATFAHHGLIVSRAC